ncbi:hypothetical protein E1263_23715 [Kribbella antibiotica]|uniref:Uncharacterized protein n=1 Tax=Kribbella antibiotica TaxID=190195 RepID=A0A4R4ZHB6_9ACTN|nr:hypothetical protein [Kribbella antibiotica]TDD57460.1 hypothetical protein E1263_23715 [Kribbella antibiotica]
MRKLAAITAAAVLLTSGLATSAWAAAPEAPTDVQVSWTDDGKVRVAWKDTGQANLVVLSSSASQYIAAEPTAADPNELLLDPRIFPDQAEMRVSLRTVVDREKSTPAYSSVFDTRRVARPSLVSASSSSGSSVRMLLQREAITDKNPADLLDQPGGEWLKATVAGPAAGQQTEISLPAGAEHIVVPVQPGAVTIKLSTGNEWGTSQIYGTVQVGTMRVSASLPARASWQMFTITGRVHMSSPNAGEAVAVAIQTRPNAASPWKFLTGTSAQTGGAILPATLGAAGGQEYRLWVHETSAFRNENTYLLTPAASTTGKFVRRNALIDRSEFFPTRAPASTTVTLLVHVGPELPMKAALQKWDGKKWVYLRAVQLDTKGNASIPMRAPLRGVGKYRIATPAVKYKGLPVDATTSLPFALKVL